MKSFQFDLWLANISRRSAVLFGIAVLISGLVMPTLSTKWAQADSVIDTIPVGATPSGIAFDSANGNLYVINQTVDTVTVINGATNTVVGSPIPMGSAPTAIAFDSANGNLYVTNFSDYTVSVINGATNTVVGSPIPMGSGPTAIAFDSANGNLYVTNFSDNTVSVISTSPPPAVPLSPSKDSFIKHDKSNVNDGANPQLQVRRTDTQRTLIAFDQTDITQASQGKTLQSATLKMFIIENSNSWGSGRTIELHMLKTDWTEGNGKYTLDGFRGTGAGVTWNCPTDTNIANDNRDCSNSWSGGSFVSTVSVKKTITNGLTGLIEFDVTKDVKAFLAGSSSNYGWIIKKTQEDRSGHVFFASGEAASNQPVLEIRYS